MKFDSVSVRKCLKSYDFTTLFREHLGWDKHQATLEIPLAEGAVRLNAVAQKHGFLAYVCDTIPDRATRLKVDHQVTKSAREHFVIYTGRAAGQQVWQWVRREPGKPLASRDHRFDVSTSGDALIQRLNTIAISLDEEDSLTVVDVAGRAKAAFDVDKVTKKFYDRFKAEHAAFLKFIKGIKAQGDLEWYTSLMLNRLMFVYFIQKKAFLDGDLNYLQNRMKAVREHKGKDKFLSFYRYFLLRLFHDGLGKPEPDRKLDRELEKLIGKVPYLNGGFFEVHQLEERNPDIEIKDEAFVKLFAFFDEFAWHLDERPLRAGNEINPDVVGYIFEKYINQKQMGAYYTKEDITEYISKNTIIPFLFDAAEKKCPIAFKPDSALWKLLPTDPDRYLYAAVRKGVIDDKGEVIPLPKDIEAGVADVSKRGGWNKPAPEPFALPTETWREHVARRQRCLEVRGKLARGEVNQINELITLNLDLWQFARDAIVNCEGPELLRAFWHTINGRVPEKSNEKYEAGMTVLDPTCGSGAFLFAALRILETLYSDCLQSMASFVDADDVAWQNEPSDKTAKKRRYDDFRAVLAQTAKHPNERYFILKSIIISNLFGVDIMEEAVEICKLRLFLKLVANVETAEQIEPLPDIDFNIRAGNTLVGYVSLEEIRNSQKGTLGFPDDDLKRIEEDADIVERAFRQFRQQQTKHGGIVTAADKKQLRDRLKKLDGELDRYLAGEYGIDANKPKVFDAWKTSHQPFHWFVEFYGIMHGGGFDVIVGNPPYLEKSKLAGLYTIRSYSTEDCRDIYAWCIERSVLLQSAIGRIGLIVPVSIVASENFGPLRKIIKSNNARVMLSHFANRPGQLFSGAQNRLSILMRSPSAVSIIESTRFHRWNARDKERESLFSNISYVTVPSTLSTFHGLIPKTGHPAAVTLLSKLMSKTTLKECLLNESKHPVHWVRVPGYFCQYYLTPPTAKPEGGGKARVRGEVNTIFCRDVRSRRVLHALLNSSTWYQFYTAFTDGRHVNPSDVKDFPLDAKRLFDSDQASQLVLLSEQLENCMHENTSHWRKSGLLIESVNSQATKPILDKIDAVLASFYGFNGEELDYIINYDIKYRMGQEGDGEEGE